MDKAVPSLVAIITAGRATGNYHVSYVTSESSILSGTRPRSSKSSSDPPRGPVEVFPAEPSAENVSYRLALWSVSSFLAFFTHKKSLSATWDGWYGLWRSRLDASRPARRTARFSEILSYHYRGLACLVSVIRRRCTPV
jgi:hypothetical protein